MAQNTEIVINLNGGFSIATDNGKFDLAEFEKQIIASVQRAIKAQEFNAKNRSIIPIKKENRKVVALIKDTNFQL